MLITIDGLLPPGELRGLREALAGAAWQDGAASAGALARQVKRNQQLADGDVQAQTLSGQVLRIISAHPLFVSAALPRRIHPPRFNRHADGGHYGSHVDSALMALSGTDPGAPMPSAPSALMRSAPGALMRSDLSATLFLSEPGQYEGGELEIETPFGAQSVKLPAGSLVLYPSSSLHRVRPVTRGARIAAILWIESLVRDDAARTLLFDLDRAIQALQMSSPTSAQPLLPPDDSRLLQLSGIYHNLLRRWASP